jgi:probable DNA repair protein
LLPIQIQREFAMPHASPRHDWELAQAITSRLLASAPIVRFSCAGQKKGVEARPSRLVAQLAGPPQPLPADLAPPALLAPLTIRIEDSSEVAFPPGPLRSGASILTAQSQCPFKAFAIARLDARGWQPAEAGLTAAQRGKLLHAVLHAIWGGPPHGLRSRQELQQLSGREAFVEDHVQRAFRDEMPTAVRESMPRRYLELEARRLTRLVTEWLAYEATRLDFTVAETEADRPITLAGLTFTVRLDRIDRLSDGTMLVIDYKSGAVTPRSWQLPRPNDVQLPLYAGFAMTPVEELGGFVLAKMRAGDQAFTGHVADAGATLFAGLKGNNSLIKSPLTAEQLIDWKQCIEQLARDFLAGRADVNPRQNPQPCERCDLHALCRIQENQNILEDQNEYSEFDEAADD